MPLQKRCDKMLSLRQSLYLLGAWLIALTAFILTQYSTLILHQPVCYLCWYQRICLYPLVMILGIGIFKSDLYCIRYALPLAVLAALFALYQYALQMIPGFSPISVCGLGPSCSDIGFVLWGFITWPFLSFTASFLMIVLLILTKMPRSNFRNHSFGQDRFL